MFDFTDPLDFQQYSSRIVDQVLSKKNTIFQLAFDFFDCSTDNQISEFDLFKIFQHYNTQDWFSESLLPDILTLSKAFSYKKNLKEQTEFQRDRQFRH